MLFKISLGEVNGTEHILLSSSKEEIDWIINRKENKEFESAKFIGTEEIFKVLQVVGWGDAQEISEQECRRYIPSIKSRGEQVFRCATPINGEQYVHVSARAAWQCAWNAINRPEYVVLIKVIPKIKEHESGDSNTEVH